MATSYLNHAADSWKALSALGNAQCSTYLAGRCQRLVKTAVDSDFGLDGWLCKLVFYMLGAELPYVHQ